MIARVHRVEFDRLQQLQPPLLERERVGSIPGALLSDVRFRDR